MREALLPEHREALKPLRGLLDEGEFYLAGGTGVYYHLEHRESLDLDFFLPKQWILPVWASPSGEEASFLFCRTPFTVK